MHRFTVYGSNVPGSYRAYLDGRMLGLWKSKETVRRQPNGRPRENTRREPEVTQQERCQRDSAHRYYRRHQTMSEIGKSLGVSRHRVGRLLRGAVETGLVRIEIRAPSGENAELKEVLERALGLKTALVVDVAPDLSPEQIKHTTCRAASHFLRGLLRADRTIGVGWGSSIPWI